MDGPAACRPLFLESSECVAFEIPCHKCMYFPWSGCLTFQMWYLSGILLFAQMCFFSHCQKCSIGQCGEKNCGFWTKKWNINWQVVFSPSDLNNYLRQISISFFFYKFIVSSSKIWSEMLYHNSAWRQELYFWPKEKSKLLPWHQCWKYSACMKYESDLNLFCALRL